jgi:hypothetical protein
MSDTAGGVADEIVLVARDLAARAPDASSRDAAQAVVERLEGPLRVAIAGRVKAGKSTLLNALVGERLAPTDAGECTRLVSRYRRGAGYEVVARLKDGSATTLGFDRNAGALDIRLGGIAESDVELIDVAWPTSTLAEMTLIDTPGLASVNDENSRRTRDFLEADGERSGDADAVIYLLRHAHRSDVSFLDAFMDRSVTAASPVNAVAVLSRADEIGGGRLDAMDSAERIASRYERDAEFRTLCTAVVPMAGLLAETGLTLREDEAAALRTLAATGDDELTTMLLSADHFCEVSASDLTVEIRRELLDRLGLFGVRLAVQEIRSGRASTAATLGPLLVEVSGLPDLRRVLTRHFGPRARVLQARTALVSLRSIARDLRSVDPALAADIERELERIEVSTIEFALARGAHLVASGAVDLSADERVEIERVVDGLRGAAVLGLPSTASGDQVRAASIEAITRWRTRAGDPLADPTTVEVCDIAVRSFERAYADAG